MASTEKQYNYTTFDIELDIGGTVFKDVVSISATFGVNAIPTAVVQLAAGKNVKTGQSATIQKPGIIDKLLPRTKATVRLTVKNNGPAANEKQETPDGTHIIFDGYYAGFGYQRSVATAVYTIHLIHWIDDLNCSSILNGNWFQGAPHDLAQAAVPPVLRDPGAGVFELALTASVAKDYLSIEKIEKDLWAETIKPIFEGFTTLEHVAIQGSDSDAGGRGGANNAAAQDALRRMPGNAPKPSKLPLSAVKDIPEVMITAALRDGLAHTFKNGLAYTSFWSKLIGELGASFLFGVSPSAEFANVFPYYSGLRDTWRTITTDDYNYANFNTQAATLIESIDIFYTSRNSSNFDLGGAPGSGFISFYHPLGRFPKENDRDLRGQIIIREPPFWCTMYAPLSIYAGRSALDPRDPHAARGNAQGPPQNAPTAVQAEDIIKTSGLLDKYAKHWYQTAILSQRSGELSGRLRFDIAPGSMVAIETENPQPAAYTPATYSGPGSGATQSSSSRGSPAAAKPTTLYAMVTQVSYVINAEQHAAGTSFSFISVRNGKENENDKFTAADPPLYEKGGWPGGPLITGITS